ncbi:MAG: type II toxin-antitoxin system Phd/YefM family antitoxin [Oxalobacter sp.]|nr:type II toxin-antitoxin system Phd/YefM family antitoxin [Oxalobacter sp.]
MQQTQWNLQDAKNRFSEVVNGAVSGQAQFITKRGVPAVVVISQEQYNLFLKGLKQAPTLPDMLMAMPHADDEQGMEKDLYPVSLSLRMNEVDL